MSKARQVTFEQGYDRLNEIVNRLDENVTVDEMVALLREGKGLEKALRDYLDTKEGELEQIEAGENLPEYTIVAIADGDGQSAPADFMAPAPGAREGFSGSGDEMAF
jgi:exodeoxyribonuclease VII small subunit